MRYSLLLAALLALPVSSAEMVYKTKDLTIRLHESECSIPQLAVVLEEGEKTKARNATILVSEREIPGCWLAFQDAEGPKVLIGDVLGNGGYIMQKDFQADSGV